MATMDSSARLAYEAGRFLEAWRLLNGRSSSVPEQVLECQLLQALGRSDEASERARRLLKDFSAADTDRARLAGVIATDLHEAGDTSGAINWWHRALHFAEEAKDPVLVSYCTAQILERSCDRSGFDSTLPWTAKARKAAARTAEPQSRATMHLTFAKLEARLGRHGIARRHFATGRELLKISPNDYLAAAFDIDESSLLMLIGDPEGALDLARRAVEYAERSGWAKGLCAGYANISCLCVALNRFEEAEKYLDLAGRVPFRSLSYELALVDTRALLKMCHGNVNSAREILTKALETSDSASLCYSLYARYTLARLLLRSGEAAEASLLSRKCLESARAAGAGIFIELYTLLIVEADLLCGNIPYAVGASREPVSDSLSLLGARYLATGKLVAVTSSGTSRGLAHIRRSRRVLASAVNKAAELEALATEGLYLVEEKGGSLAGQTLDSAVALLELSAHPHILGREAFTLLEESGCAQSIVLLAAGQGGTRVIAAAGLAEEEAAAAASAPPPDDRILLGTHRDEQWALLVAPKPGIDEHCTLAAIRKLLGTAVTLERYRRDEKQRAALWPAEELEGDPESLWASEQAAEILGIARRIAATPLPVLLTGETGTGKEMLARAIHRASNRAERPLVPFNASAVPRDLVESQLFGYRKGAFTGADAPFPGVIRSAAGGTLFLDEIADVPMELQPKLLRFLEHQEVQPLGEPQPTRVDVRVIAATNANLDALVAQGRFREDLLYRLNVVQLRLPPLRERREEIPTLVDHYIRKHGDELKKGQLTLSDETLEYLLLYSWPGNIRQLANEVRRMVALAEPDSTLTPALLSPEIQASRRTIPAAAGATPEIRVPLDQPLPVAVDLVERMLVRRALERSQGRVEEAARLLGISRKGLFLKRRRWGLRQAS